MHPWKVTPTEIEGETLLRFEFGEIDVTMTEEQLLQMISGLISGERTVLEFGDKTLDIDPPGPMFETAEEATTWINSILEKKESE